MLSSYAIEIAADSTSLSTAAQNNPPALFGIVVVKNWQVGETFNHFYFLFCSLFLFSIFIFSILFLFRDAGGTVEVHVSFTSVTRV